MGETQGASKFFSLSFHPNNFILQTGHELLIYLTNLLLLAIIE